MGDSRGHTKLSAAAVAVLLLLGLGATGCRPAAGGSPAPAPPVEPDDPSGDGADDRVTWAEIDKLIEDQQYQAALERVAVVRAGAQQAGDEEEWARALVREVQLRIGLHGYETSVRHLRATPWPEQPIYRAVLELFYAHSLVDYLSAYGWEIRGRERVESGDEVDLRAWTREQIADEIDGAYGRVWGLRGDWGDAGLGELKEYFDPNDYPQRIRGTLRDAVTYLWVAWLADTSHWDAAAENGVYRLDLAALLAAEPEAPAPHPLARLVTRLADLESWHRDGNRPEAAFEARLERLRRLWEAFSRGDDRERIRQALERALDELGPELEWWAVGQEMLASWVRQEDAPDSLVRAREIALAGLERHPDSIGGRRCRHLIAAIEAPEYRLEAMLVDGLDRRSVRVRHRNLAGLSFRAYRLDLLSAVESAQDRNLLPGYREVDELVKARRPDAEWRLELPPTPDYRQHDTYVTPPLDDPGLWVLVASPRKDFGGESNRRSAVQLILSDLVLLTRNFDDELEITVRSGATGKPVDGAEVRIYRQDWRRGHRLTATRRTGAEGTVVIEKARGQGTHFAVARHGDQVAIDRNTIHLHRHPVPGERTTALVYTDRSVYRPGQEILWKVVAYQGRADKGRYRVASGSTFTVALRDANGEQVGTTEVTTNRHGSASGRFRIPQGRLLGRWRLQTSFNTGPFVQVEEYKRPTFEVEITEPTKALRLNRPARLTGEARYYFGLPVAGGDYSWQVTREPVWSFRHWWWSPPRTTPQTIAAGTGELTADGEISVEFTPEADERQTGDGVSYRYRLSVDVTDEGGETRSAERVYRLGFVAVEARLDPQQGFFEAGEAPRIGVRRMDLDGTPRPGAGSWRLLELEQPERALLPTEVPSADRRGDERAAYRTPGDELRPRWTAGEHPGARLARWADGRELARGDSSAGDDGQATVRLPPLAAGAYRLRYQTRDPWNAVFETQVEFVVAAEAATDLALPLMLLKQQPSVAVGSAVRLLIHSGLAQQELVLELLRGNRRLERRRLSSAAGLQIVEIPVTEEDRGGLGFRLTAVRDHQVMTLADSVQVPWDDRRLELSFASFRDRLRPGDRETWRVTVRGAGEETLAAGAAELLAYMYDRSLDLFGPHRPPRVSEIYPGRGRPSPPRHNLGPGREIWSRQHGWRNLPGYPSLRGDRLLLYSSYGIGGPGHRRYRGGGVAMRTMAMPDAAPATAEVALEGDDRVEAEARAEDLKALGYVTAQGAPSAAEEEPPVELRTDFSETAFWEPHLVLGADGTVAFEFEVPDSVTEWSVWVHAVTRDLAGGSLNREARSVKELLVRPYLPRFLREGDRAVIRVLVNNAGEEPLAGALDFDLLDPETEASLLAEFGLDAAAVSAVPFRVEPGGGAELEFELQAPIRVGDVAVRAVARAGDLSDGEQRPLPLLPGRLHLAQSRFAALEGEDRRELRFADLADAGADPSLVHDQLVVTLDAQLFTSVLRALPYLVDYPYECTEQTLNRFLSTGVLTSLYDDYPAVARLARELSRRETRLEPWDAEDPNRKMALVETPWRVAARGGGDENLIRVLDPGIAAAQRRASLDDLRKAQTSLGGFPWWPGGPPSPYMTLYLLHGFSRAVEFDVETPKEMVQRAWSYMHRHYLDEIARDMVEEDCCWQFVTFLNYVLSAYPDDSWTGGVFSDEERRQMLDHSWSHWREHSPLLKGYLALTLDRAGRHEDARLVFDSVMDSSKTDPDLGTWWAPEERAWLWYNDTVEGHAFALRVMTELAPEDARRHGLVQWLLLNKKLNHWKSTRTTAEVMYAMVHYLEGEGALGVREEAAIAVGPRAWQMTFEPDELAPEIVERGGEPGAAGERLGKPNQIVIPGAEIDPVTMASVVVEKSTPSFLFASATWHFSTDRLPEEAEGDLFRVTRSFFRRVHQGDEWVLQPLAEGARIEVGDALEVQLSVRARHAAEYVHLRDPRGAGFEPETLRSGYKWDLGLGWYEEVRDSGTNFFFEWLPAGEYTLRYRLRAATGGTFRVGPATLQSMYAPEFTAYSAGHHLAVD